MEREKIRLLLIEDNPGDVRLVREYLHGALGQEFVIDHFDRLDKARARLRADDFDLVLLDLCLPDERGLDTLVSARLENNQVPIIVLTGSDDEIIGVKAMQAGAQDYLIKGQF